MTLFSPLTSSLETLGDYYYFLKSFLRNTFRKGFEGAELYRQCYNIGYKSIGITMLTGFILGIVLTLQSQPTLKDFGAESYIPGMVSISVIREICPVIIALICSGKIASGIGAELGSMNVTEQIDAMEVSGANPVQFLVVPRVLACMMMVPLLTIVADAVAMAGGYTASALTNGITAQLYFTKAISVLKFSDIIPAVIKTIFFGFAIGFTGCWNGFHSNQGTESVGIAANKAVVTASVAVIIIDAVIVQITNWLVYS
jgi:phospholipid/cholesterol/gamma-HCH transport system permease protein